MQRQSNRKTIALWCDKDHNKHKYTNHCKGTNKKVKMIPGKLGAERWPFYQGMDATAKGKKRRKWPRTLPKIQRSRWEESPKVGRESATKVKGREKVEKVTTLQTEAEAALWNEIWSGILIYNWYRAVKEDKNQEEMALLGLNSILSLYWYGTQTVIIQSFKDIKMTSWQTSILVI